VSGAASAGKGEGAAALRCSAVCRGVAVGLARDRLRPVCFDPFAFLVMLTPYALQSARKVSAIRRASAARSPRKLKGEAGISSATACCDRNTSYQDRWPVPRVPGQ